jgi:hypothetical protein
MARELTAEQPMQERTLHRGALASGSGRSSAYAPTPDRQGLANGKPGSRW